MRHETLITRKNGREIKIVSESFSYPGGPVTIDSFVLYRDDPAADWTLCKRKSEHDTKTMSRADYMSYGRPEFLTIVTIGEFLKAGQTLRNIFYPPKSAVA